MGATHVCEYRAEKPTFNEGPQHDAGCVTTEIATDVGASKRDWSGGKLAGQIQSLVSKSGTRVRLAGPHTVTYGRRHYAQTGLRLTACGSIEVRHRADARNFGHCGLGRWPAELLFPFLQRIGSLKRRRSSAHSASREGASKRHVCEQLHTARSPSRSALTLEAINGVWPASHRGRRYLRSTQTRSLA